MSSPEASPISDSLDLKVQRKMAVDLSLIPTVVPPRMRAVAWIWYVMMKFRKV